MNITRTLNIIKVKAIYYDQELKCEISKDLTFIGRYSNKELEKMIHKHPDVGILIDFELESEEENLYGMPVETFYNNSEIIKKKRRTKS